MVGFHVGRAVRVLGVVFAAFTLVSPGAVRGWPAVAPSIVQAGDEGTTSTVDETTTSAPDGTTTSQPDGTVVTPGVAFSPTSGTPGTPVQVVDAPCPVTRVSFGGTTATVTDGTFQVPGVAARDYSVEALCGSSTAGVAGFTVESGPPSTVPPPTTGTTAPDEPQDECAGAAELAQAQLAFEPERRMVVDRSHTVFAVLSLGDLPLPPDVTFESPTTVAPVPEARCRVTAELSGHESEFDIAPPDPRTQSFIGTRQLVWDWRVRPLQPGDFTLTLRVQPIGIENGTEVELGVKVEDAEVSVESGPQSFWSRVSGWLRDVFGHPAVPVVVVPAVGAAYVWLRRRYWPRHAAPVSPPRGPAGPDA